MLKNLIDYIKSHKHILFIIYAPIHFIWFAVLEAWTKRDFTILHCKLDDIIPFIPHFIIPYYLWFPFVAFFCIYFYIKMPVKETVKFYTSLVSGMVLTLIIYTIWPNALSLRPEIIEDGSIIGSLVSGLYVIDTDTNVCPSLHVLNTLAIDVAYFVSDKFRGRHLQNIMMIILSALICMSTVFLKQHSVIDVISAVIVCIVISLVVYLPDKLKKNSSKKSNAEPTFN